MDLLFPRLTESRQKRYQRISRLMPSTVLEETLIREGSEVPEKIGRLEAPSDQHNQQAPMRSQDYSRLQALTTLSPTLGRKIPGRGTATSLNPQYSQPIELACPPNFCAAGPKR